MITALYLQQNQLKQSLFAHTTYLSPQQARNVSKKAKQILFSLQIMLTEDKFIINKVHLFHTSYHKETNQLKNVFSFFKMSQVLQDRIL